MIEHVASVSGSTTATTSDTIVIPTVLPNDYLMLCCTNKGANAVPTVADDDTGGNTWVRIDGVLLNRSSVWFKRATAGTTGKTITASGFTTGCAIGMSVYRGVVVDAPENLTAVFQASGLETIAGITPSRDGSLICLVLSHQNLNVNMTSEQCANLGALAERFDVGNTDQPCQVGHASVIQSVAGPTGAFTWATANSGHVTTVFNLLPEASQPAASAGGGSAESDIAEYHARRRARLKQIEVEEKKRDEAKQALVAEEKRLTAKKAAKKQNDAQREKTLAKITRLNAQIASLDKSVSTALNELKEMAEAERVAREAEELRQQQIADRRRRLLLVSLTAA